MNTLTESAADARNRMALGWLNPLQANRRYKLSRCADCTHLRPRPAGQRSGRYCARLELPTGITCWCRAFAWRRRS